jgi:hypothetical protein
MTELMNEAKENLLHYYEETQSKKMMKFQQERLAGMSDMDAQLEWELISMREYDSYMNDCRYVSSLEPANYDNDNYAYYE